MNHTKGLEPRIIFSDGISLEEKFKWRRVIYAMFFALSKEEQEIVPPFYIYNTMIQCLYETLDYTHPMVDQLADSFYEKHVWSFAFFQEERVKNPASEDDWKRIVVANTRTSMTPDLSPETVILHEIGHFVKFFLEGKPYRASNKNDIEIECNDYAIKQYMKTIFTFPFYFTQSKDLEVSQFEESVRFFLDKKTREYNLFFPMRNSDTEKIFKEYEEIIYG